MIPSGGDGGRSRDSELPLQRRGERGQLAVALNAAELRFGGEHAGGRPAQRHLARLPALHAAGVASAMAGAADVAWGPPAEDKNTAPATMTTTSPIRLNATKMGVELLRAGVGA